MTKPGTRPSIGVTLLWIVVMVAVCHVALSHSRGSPVGSLVLGAVLGYLVAQLLHLRGLVDALQGQVAAQGDAPRVARPIAPAEPAPPAAVPVARYQTPAPAAAAPATSLSAASAVPTTARHEIPRPPPRPAPPGPLDKALGDALAWVKRGNPLARIGIVVMFFGGTFLAKYSAEHGMFPLEARLAALATGAIVLLGLGWRLRARRATFAQVLQGGGIAGFYLTVFAATRLYHLLPHSLALSLLVAAAVASAILAVAQNALALAVIGFSGGFLAPILLSTGGGSHVALFTYYTILNLGIFTVAWFRAWRVLNLVGFVFTFGIAGLFRATGYDDAKLVSTDFFLLLFFLLYVGVAVLFSLRQPTNLRNYVSGSLVFGVPLAAFGLHATLISRIEYGLAFSALGFGAFYLALAWVLFRSRREMLTLLCEAFAALGVIFASLAIPLAFDQRTTAAMWAVEGAGLLWIGVRQDRKLARAFGALLQVLAGIGYLLGLREGHGDLPWLNSAYVGTLMLGVSGLLSGWWLLRNREREARHEKGLDAAFALWAVGWLLFGGLAEIDRSLLVEVRYGAALIYAAFLIALLHLLAHRLGWALLDTIALVLLPLAGVVAVGVAADAHPFARVGFAGWPALMIVWYTLLKRLEPSPDQALAAPVRWLHAAGLWLIALVATWETSWRVAQHVAGIWPALAWGLGPAVALWICARAPRMWPFTTQVDAYRRIAAPPLVVFSAAWTVAANLTLGGDPSPLPYLPLLNPLDVSVGLVFCVIASYALALAPAERAQLWPFERKHFWATVVALVFLWLNAALIRALHYGVGTPLDFHGIRHSVLVQASLSVFWGLLALSVITIAARRGQRVLWICGAALMGVVVAKLFVIDLDGSGTLARIISFLSVGAILLLAGYLSPLPPSAAAREPVA